jgi:glycogen synthase
MNISILTNEYPPNIYGGAGIHVKFLVRELKELCKINVRCFGDQVASESNLEVKGVKPCLPQKSSNKNAQKLIETLDCNLQMAASLEDTDLVHCHTWYSHWAGMVSSTLLDIPLVLSTHSLEPHRPWKIEQLGQGYRMSSWIEKQAYQQAHGIIAVSSEMKKDVCKLYNTDPDRVQVIYNGIDPVFYSKTEDPSILNEHGIDPTKPFILFVGRITRQKGITHLIKAIPMMNPNVQVVLCAGAPDTPEIAAESEKAIKELQAKRPGVIWISEMLAHEKLRVLYSMAQAFVCPSVYEPFGIINLEAMSCETPVIGSAVGGIPEIIVDNKTGLLVPFKSISSSSSEPADPAAFQQDLALAVNKLIDDPAMASAMGKASRQRVEELFSWKSIAQQTLEFYSKTIERYKAEK